MPLDKTVVESTTRMVPATSAVRQPSSFFEIMQQASRTRRWFTRYSVDVPKQSADSEGGYTVEAADLEETVDSEGADDWREVTAW